MSELEELRAQLQQERQLREEEQRRREEEQRRRVALEGRTEQTTLPEYLHYLHTHLYIGLNVQEDQSQTTGGNASNANRKLRPERIVPWPDFAAHQSRIWDILMDSDLMDQRHFTSIHTLQETGERLRRKALGSELDLHIFSSTVIDDPVNVMVERISEHATLSQRLGLRGSVRFENHGNTLSPDHLSADVQRMGLESDRAPRRSARLRSQGAPAEPEQGSAASDVGKMSRPRADNFAVYGITTTTGELYRMAILLMEFKAPHKLTLGHINTGLTSIDLDDIVEERVEEDVERRCQRLVAAVISQLFSYMIQAGLEYGCVSTGVAMIFVRVTEDDFSTVQYALSVPHGDVGLETGWTSDLQCENRLHLTAAGQLLAFVLNATQSHPRRSAWRDQAATQLTEWVITMEEIEDSVPEKEVPVSEYQPPTTCQDSLLLRSPICRRLRKRDRVPRQGSPEATTSRPNRSDSDDDDDDDDLGQRRDATDDTPSRPQANTDRGAGNQTLRGRGSRGQASRGQASCGRAARDVERWERLQQAPLPINSSCPELGPYCTTPCLKGLVEGGLLDMSCPNVQCHRTVAAPDAQHPIDIREFRRQMRHVLRHELAYVEELMFSGRKGWLYRVRLPQSGYAFVAKGTRAEYVADLKREARVWQDHLMSVQGLFTPVFLGSFTLSKPLWYVGSVPIVHLMALSFGGHTLNLLRGSLRVTDEMREQAVAGLQAIHATGVLHGDVAPRNLAWDKRTQQCLWLDFDEARELRRPPLTECHPNKRRKFLERKHNTPGTETETLFRREIVKANDMLCRQGHQ